MGVTNCSIAALGTAQSYALNPCAVRTVLISVRSWVRCTAFTSVTPATIGKTVDGGRGLGQCRALRELNGPYLTSRVYQRGPWTGPSPHRTSSNSKSRPLTSA